MLQKNNSELNSFIHFLSLRNEAFNSRVESREVEEKFKDLILEKYKFCNVKRELDRVSLYFIDKVILNPKFSKLEILLNSYILRIFNLVEYLDYIKFPFSLDDLSNPTEILSLSHNYKGSRFNIAYHVGTITPSSEYRTKHEQVFKYLQKLCNSKQDLKNLEEITNSVIEFISGVSKMPGIGKFMSYELFCDCCYSNLFTSDKFNINSYVNLGPGALGGLYHIYGKENYEDLFKKLLIELNLIQRDFNPVNIKYGKVAFSVRDLEHSLCEYRKYCQKIENRGRKIKYRPKKIYDISSLKKFYDYWREYELNLDSLVLDRSGNIII